MLQNDLAQSQLLAKTANIIRMRPHLFTRNTSQIINNVKVDFLTSDTQLIATINKFTVIGVISFTNVQVQPTMTTIIDESVSTDWENNAAFIGALYQILIPTYSLIVSTNVQSDNQQKIWKLLAANTNFIVNIQDGNKFRTKTDTVTLDQATIDQNIANNIPATVETGVKLVTSNVIYNSSNVDDSDIWSIYPNATLLDTKLVLSGN
jgi:hypothetical protein